MAIETDDAVDGRRARRARNRAAVIDAMLTLVLDRGAVPATDEVARRAGVSVSSLFRYFDSLDDLQQEAVATYFERFGHLFDLEGIGVGTFTDRTHRLVAARVSLHATVAPVARLVRQRTIEGSAVAGRLAEIRARLAQQVREHFAAELADRSPATADDVASTIDVLTSFESWALLHDAHGRSDAQIRRAWVSAIRALLTA